MSKNTIVSDFNSYNDYITLEWEKFEAEKNRYDSISSAVNLLEVKRVLDIGCGAGQEMLPFVENDAYGVGIDIMPSVGEVGRIKYAEKGLQNKVIFINASGDNLPFADSSFDILICRSSLMYMDVKLALSEMSRVLNKNGKVFLKIHKPNYYWWRVGEGLKHGEFKTVIHAIRVLLNGMWFSIGGKQLNSRLTAGGEIFLSKKALETNLKQNNFEIIGELPDTNSQTPSFLMVKID